MAYVDYENPTLTLKVKLEVERDGERKKEEHTLRYRAITDEVAAEINKLPEDRKTLAHQLALLVTEMRNGDGSDFKPSVEFFQKMAPKNKRIIEQAIEDDSRPN